ncbi:hypothetical protein AAF712_009326 [Marasmius tenuissimus]|uniref:TEA domain-containing protein n=1 Tax=Marasmius tenuissimus TaxID=585030 RepID=A0ABR2ZRH9_9AGAR
MEYSQTSSNSSVTFQDTSIATVNHTISRRKTWRAIDSSGELIWCPELEAALIAGSNQIVTLTDITLTCSHLAGLEKYRPHFLATPLSAPQRFPRRNRWLSGYILEVTGKFRTAKQVGSRIQQLKRSCKDEKILRLVETKPSLRFTPEPLSRQSSTSGTYTTFKTPSSPQLLFADLVSYPGNPPWESPAPDFRSPTFGEGPWIIDKASQLSLQPSSGQDISEISGDRDHHTPNTFTPAQDAYIRSNAGPAEVSYENTADGLPSLQGLTDQFYIPIRDLHSQINESPWPDLNLLFTDLEHPSNTTNTMFWDDGGSCQSPWTTELGAFSSWGQPDRSSECTVKNRTPSWCNPSEAATESYKLW